MTQNYEPPAPPTSTPMDYQALNGALLLVKVISLEPHIPTVHTQPGEKSPAIVADVTVLDGLKQGEVLENTMIFPKVLQGQLSRSIGKTVLGRLGQGVAKPGQTAPWVLVPASDQDTANADRWFATRAQAGLSAPGAPAMPTAQPPF